MMTFKDGCQEVPSGPGLGVEIDEDKAGETGRELPAPQ